MGPVRNQRGQQYTWQAFGVLAILVSLPWLMLLTSLCVFTWHYGFPEDISHGFAPLFFLVVSTFIVLTTMAASHWGKNRDHPIRFSIVSGLFWGIVLTIFKFVASGATLNVPNDGDWLRWFELGTIAALAAGVGVYFWHLLYQQLNESVSSLPRFYQFANNRICRLDQQNPPKRRIRFSIRQVLILTIAAAGVLLWLRGMVLVDVLPFVWVWAAVTLLQITLFSGLREYAASVFAGSFLFGSLYLQVCTIFLVSTFFFQPTTFLDSFPTYLGALFIVVCVAPVIWLVGVIIVVFGGFFGLFLWPQAWFLRRFYRVEPSGSETLLRHHQHFVPPLLDDHDWSE